ncbi:hypothetical protein ACJRO7_015297 [Eucalyptus globulus]|uniref:Uncharacterized protein n=1 Tax=Eucalyptus globulus TaxID=34317 RepID=A0ABD3L8V6_EUCGL
MFFVPFAICGLKRLSSLKLEGQCIQGLHSSIGEIVGLTSLSLKGCHQLRKLPDSIGKLRSLLILNLFDTGITELPDSIGDLKKLEKMNLGFTKIMELRNSIGGLESLLELHLWGTEITELPASIGFLKRLECLVLAEMPTTINQLSHLRELRLGDNRKLEKLPELPATLKHLYFVAETVLGTRGQTSSKWMGESPKGEEWSLSTDITWPPQLWSLRISCDDPRSLTRLPFSLCRLELGDVKSPIEQPFFSNLRYLRYMSELTLFRCWSREIEFELLASLQNLTVAECELLVRLSGLSSLGKLKELKVWNCSQLVEIQDLGEVKSLMELLIKSCSTIKMLQDLSKLRKLQILRLFHCESLQGLPDIPKTCHPYVHRCPMLGESVDNYKACEECRNSDMDVDGA